MPGYNCTAVPGVKPNICCAGGSGTLLGGTMGLGRVPEGIIYLLLLLWTFFGVAIVADIFMTAIEQVTSQTYTVKQIIDGTTRRFPITRRRGGSRHCNHADLHAILSPF